MSNSTKTLVRPDGSTLELNEFDICCDLHIALLFENWATPAFQCDEPARWVGFYPCCGKHALVCDRHQADANPYFCSSCKKHWDTLINWVRL